MSSCRSQFPTISKLRSRGFCLGKKFHCLQNTCKPFCACISWKNVLGTRWPELHRVQHHCPFCNVLQVVLVHNSCKYLGLMGYFMLTALVASFPAEIHSRNFTGVSYKSPLIIDFFSFHSSVHQIVLFLLYYIVFLYF